MRIKLMMGGTYQPSYMSRFFAPKLKAIDPYSSGVSAIALMFDETLLSNATGFFWESDGKKYLVTNWHNVTGINPLTGKHLSSNSGEPNRVEIDTYVAQNLNQRH